MPTCSECRFYVPDTEEDGLLQWELDEGQCHLHPPVVINIFPGEGVGSYYPQVREDAVACGDFIRQLRSDHE